MFCLRAALKMEDGILRALHFNRDASLLNSSDAVNVNIRQGLEAWYANRVAKSKNISAQMESEDVAWIHIDLGVCLRIWATSK